MARSRDISKVFSAETSLVTTSELNSALSSIDLSSTIVTASSAAVSALINGAPAALDTLNELSTALQNDPNFYNTISNVYLSQSSASSNYLRQSSASTVYLTQSSASTTYVRKTGANYAVSNAIAITHGNTSPTTIASVTLTTTGNPVLLAATGDMNPTGGPTWFWFRIYRGETALGKLVLCESTGNSINVPYANVHIDTPSAGTYTYSLRSWRGGANSASFGETGNDQAPTILAVELF